MCSVWKIATSGPGELCVTIGGLLPATDYCYVGRARDGAGNQDANTVERCVTTPAADCVDYDTMVQKLYIAICQFSKRQMTWFRRMQRSGIEIHWIDALLDEDDRLKRALEAIRLA